MEIPRIDKTYDKWTAERIARHIIYWLLWMVLYASVNSSSSSIGFFRWMQIELIIMTVKLPFTYTMMYVLIPNFFLQKQYKTFVLLTMIFTGISGTLVWLFYYHYLLKEVGYISVSFWNADYFYKTLNLIYVATFPIIFKMYQYYLKEEMNKRKMAEEKLMSELELLKNQLQPHFLFNTLNNLYGLIITKHADAGPVVLQLAQMMRYMLYECNTSKICLMKEVELIQNYIALEKIRAGNRVLVHFEAEGLNKEGEIAPLLLIGFIENAFKHGIHNDIYTPWVRINIWLSNNELDFMVENSVPESLPLQRSIKTIGGIGLDNIRKRLELLYPNSYSLEINKAETFLIRLKLQLVNHLQ